MTLSNWNEEYSDGCGKKTSPWLWGGHWRGYWRRNSAKPWHKRAESGNPRVKKNLVRHSIAHSNAPTATSHSQFYPYPKGLRICKVLLATPGGFSSGKLTGGHFKWGDAVHNCLWIMGQSFQICPPTGKVLLYASP